MSGRPSWTVLLFGLFAFAFFQFFGNTSLVLGTFSEFSFPPLLNKSISFSLPMDLFWLCKEMNKTRKPMFF